MRDTKLWTPRAGMICGQVKFGGNLGWVDVVKQNDKKTTIRISGAEMDAHTASQFQWAIEAAVKLAKEWDSLGSADLAIVWHKLEVR